MERTESISRPGEALSEPPTPATEVKTAVAGFVAEFKTFRDQMTERMKQQESRMTMLDRKSTAGARPALAREADAAAPHQKAFGAYLRSGDDDGLRGLTLEGKAMSTAVAGDGGYLVDPQTSATIQGVLKSAASLRQVANVVQVEATSYDVLVDTTDIGSGWVTETGSVSESSTATVDRISIPLFELAALPKASQRLLDDSAFDIESWLAERIADKFARSEAASFISGDGTDKPTGILDHPAVADASWSWGSLGYVATGADGSFDLNDPVDAIVDLVYALMFELDENQEGHRVTDRLRIDQRAFRHDRPVGLQVADAALHGRDRKPSLHRDGFQPLARIFLENFQNGAVCIRQLSHE